MLKIYHSHIIKTMVRPLFFESKLKKIMKKQITYLFIFLISLTTLQGQVEQQSLPSTKEINNRRSSFNLEELKVRWKKAALENCPGVPCITVTVPGPPTSVTASAGNASVSVAFVAPTNNGGSAITGYTVTSSPGGVTATGATSPINVTGLTNGTAYTFTVIATNAIGNSSPSTASSAVTPSAPFLCGTSTVSDVDGNIYNTFAIGTGTTAQCWTASNLKVTKYNDGTLIGDSTTSTWGKAVIGARTGYDVSVVPMSDYVGTFGYLYNWYAVNDLRKLCPAGWHVPTDAEWTIMIQTLDPFQAVNSGNVSTFTGVQSSTAGTVMKSTVTNSSIGSGLGWNPGSPGTNTSGFTALPGGYRDFDGSFYDIRYDAFFWSATEYDGTIAWFRYLTNSRSNVYRSSIDKSVGASVRCLRD
jgi:uncharacterized protein (TIGR02145 family)